MLTQHHKSVSLSLVSSDLPVWSFIETEATLYEREGDRFHLLLTEPPVRDLQDQEAEPNLPPFCFAETPRLLWLEISPYRVIMTMQGDGRFSYRHFWEQGVYGISRYWLQSPTPKSHQQIRLRNFTRSLILRGRPLPRHLRVDYELWANQLQIGRYVMNLEIHQ